MTIIEKLWAMLDEQIAVAVPIQRKLKELQREEPGDDVGAMAIQIEKYEKAGFAPGLAMALCELLKPAFGDYKEVVKHAQERYKARQRGETLDTPMIPPGKAAPAGPLHTTKDGATPPTERAGLEVAGGVIDEAAEHEVEEEKPKPARRKRPAPDPGPSVDDIPEDELADPQEIHRHVPGDVNLEQLRKHNPEGYKRVVAAMEKAKAAAAARHAGLRDDSTDEAQAANHRADLPEPGPITEEFEATGEEQTPDDMAAMLAGLEEE